jgi:NTE family protein
LRFMLRGVLTSDAHGGARDELGEAERTMSAQGLLGRLAALFHTTPFRSLLDTAPWRRTLAEWMNFDRINSADSPALLLAATELQTGALRVFCNRAINGRPPDTIVLDHLMASSSIPIVYPWTEIGAEKYWDGAVLANTPLEPVFDLAGDEPLDIIVVMMTPWNADPEALRAQSQQMPQDLVQALSVTLDWALLASYRVAFEVMAHRNQLADAAARLARAAEQIGDDSMRMPAVPGPVALPTVIAPLEPMPLDWIIDYETANHLDLFERGRLDTERALAAGK